MCVFVCLLQFPCVGPPRDPRTEKTVLGVAGSAVDMKIPRFKARLAIASCSQIVKFLIIAI